MGQQGAWVVWACLGASSALAGDARMTPAREDGVPRGTGATAPKVKLTAPEGGWTVGRMLEVAGTVDDASINPVLVSINGDRYLLRTTNGRFSRQFPAARGRNVVTVSATNAGGTGSAQASTFAEIPAVPFKAILTSDTDGVYTDLHVYEPSDTSRAGDRLVASSMPHVFWAQTVSPTGGTFFLNEQAGGFDVPGYGPYLYVHRSPPAGVYLIAANYWPSGDKAHTLATLNLVLFEGTPQEVRRRVDVPLATRGATRELAWVNILGDGKAVIYVPGRDAVPTAPLWPSNLEAAAAELRASSPGE